jgi:hypothetical protein
VHAVAHFRGNKGGYLGNDYWMFPWNPFQERVFSLRKSLLCRPSRGHIFQLVNEVSWWPRKKEGNLEFGSNQYSVGKGCQKSGCGGYIDCRVVMIYSVVNCKAEGVRRDSVVLGC